MSEHRAGLRLVTQNIYGRRAGWESRQGVLRDGLCGLDPDVVLLQEEILTPEYDQTAALLSRLRIRCSVSDTARVKPPEVPAVHEIRIYTLRSEDALQRHATAHWPRQLRSLAAFGITTQAVHTEAIDGQHRLVAVVEYAAGADAAELTTSFMASDAFRSDIAGFDPVDILAVEPILVDQVSLPSATRFRRRAEQ